MSKAKTPAMRRARRRWGEAGLEARREIRARGLAPSPWLDDLAGCRRGTRVADGVTRLARELGEAGVPAERIRALVHSAIDHMLADGPRAA